MSGSTNAWDRAAILEHKRCKGLGLIPQEPSVAWRKDSYAVGELFELGNTNGPIATYWNGPKRLVRRNDGGIGAKGAA